MKAITKHDKLKKHVNKEVTVILKGKLICEDGFYPDLILADALGNEMFVFDEKEFNRGDVVVIVK